MLGAEQADDPKKTDRSPVEGLKKLTVRDSKAAGEAA
jgi:hypothetical protein